MTSISADPFSISRAMLAQNRVSIIRSGEERRLLATLGPDASNRSYVDGVLRGGAALHALVFGAVQLRSDPPCRLPFEVRIPKGWLTKVAATHDLALEELAASRATKHSPIATSWFGGAPPSCDHGIACSAYQRVVERIRRSGHSSETLRDLVSAADRDLLDDDADLLLRFARSICVGVGRTRDPAGIPAAERLTSMWITRYADLHPEREIERANLLRSLAFAQVVPHGPAIALNTVRDAVSVLRQVESASDADDAQLRFRVGEALFPALETLALCEERWGDVASSLEAALELVRRFPHDSRAWIRLAKSWWAVGESAAAIDALLNGAQKEHPKWLFCVITARFIAAASDLSPAQAEDFAASYRIPLKHLEIV